MSPRLEFAIRAAYRAGRSTLALFDTGTDVELKEDATPVTAADRRAEEIVREEIAKAFPGETIMGEEQGTTGEGDTRWIVDPIDGTKSFVAGVPLYATLLSYEVEGKPILGVCYLPALDAMVYAEDGGGAFWNGRPIQVKQSDSLRNGIIACGGHNAMFARDRWNGFASFEDKVMASRTWGDAYGHALVASGRIDAMMDPRVSRWDISAMIPILREAGGVTVRFDGGDPLESGEHYELEMISTTPKLRDEILAAFR